MKHILVVEDDIFIRDELVIMLQNAGYQTEVISHFHNTTHQIMQYHSDLILLDLNLPNENGFTICQNIKKKMTIPILVLTSREQLKDEIQALKLGADEYLTKPFRKERLLARIENVLKRYEGRGHLLERDDFLLDSHTFTLYIKGHSIILSPNQGKLLAALMMSDDIVTKEALAMSLWGTTTYIDENALQVNMTRLKKVMQRADMSHQIKTIRGQGYQLIKGDKHV